MSDAYMVRCGTSHPAQPMTGIYVAGLTISGMVATWKPGRARRFESATEAESVASRMARKFAGTTWEAVRV